VAVVVALTVLMLDAREPSARAYRSCCAWSFVLPSSDATCSTVACVCCADDKSVFTTVGMDSDDGSRRGVWHFDIMGVVPELSTVRTWREGGVGGVSA
jgi:hypothetical protein